MRQLPALHARRHRQAHMSQLHIADGVRAASLPQRVAKWGKMQLKTNHVEVMASQKPKFVTAAMRKRPAPSAQAPLPPSAAEEALLRVLREEAGVSDPELIADLTQWGSRRDSRRAAPQFDHQSALLQNELLKSQNDKRWVFHTDKNF